jgi:hypothetical protein
LDEQEEGLYPHGLGAGPSIAGDLAVRLHHLDFNGIAGGVGHGKECDGHGGEHLPEELPHERVLLEELHLHHVVMGLDQLLLLSHSIGLAHVGRELGEGGVGAEVTELRDRIDEEVVEIPDDSILGDQLGDGVQSPGLLHMTEKE